MGIAAVLFGAGQAQPTIQFTVTDKPVLIKAFGLGSADWVSFNEVVIQSGGPLTMQPCGEPDFCGRPNVCGVRPCLPPDLILASRPLTLGCCPIWLGSNGTANSSMVPIYVPGDYVAIFNGDLINQVVTIEEASNIIDWARVFPPSYFCCAGAPPSS